MPDVGQGHGTSERMAKRRAARARRLLILQDLYEGPKTRAELDRRHSRAGKDLSALRELGLIDVQSARQAGNAAPRWSFRGGR